MTRRPLVQFQERVPIPRRTLREIRMSQLLTVRGLAEKSGVASSAITMTENGHTRPHFASIRKIADALDVEPGDVREFAAVMLLPDYQ